MIGLSYDIVRFKIKVGVKDKFMCKNVTKQTQHGDWAVAAELWLVVIFAAAQHTTHTTHTPSRVEPNLSTRLDSF